MIFGHVLAIGGYLFNRTGQEREAARTEERARVERERAERQAELQQEIAADNQREAALQTYHDRNRGMTSCANRSSGSWS